MTVTLKQIAEHCGFSIQTVGFVLNNNKGHLFRDTTRDRVVKSAEELGYRPNGAARAMRAGRFGCVALVLSTQAGHSSLFSGLLAGIDEELVKLNLHLIHAPMPDERLTDEGYMPKILSQWMCDGLLINYNAAIPEAMTEMIARHHIPAVWMNSKQRHDCVHPDDFGGGQLATEHLIGLGHRRIAYIDYSHGSDGTPKHYCGVDRPAGYTKAMKNAGLKPRIIRDRQAVPMAERIPYTLGWLRDDDRPTAVVTNSPVEALPIVYLAASELRLRVPEDLSVICFEDEPVDSLGFRIGTILIPRTTLGQVSVQQLTAKIAAPDIALDPIALSCQLDPGQTCARPAS